MNVTKQASDLINGIFNKTEIKKRTKGGDIYLRIGMIKEDDEQFVLGYEDELDAEKDVVAESNGLKCVFDKSLQTRFEKLTVDAFKNPRAENGEESSGLVLSLDEK